MPEQSPEKPLRRPALVVVVFGLLGGGGASWWSNPGSWGHDGSHLSGSTESHRSSRRSVHISMSSSIRHCDEPGEHRRQASLFGLEKRGWGKLRGLRRLISGMSYPVTAYTRPSTAVFERLPWLLVTLGAGSISGLIISHYTVTIERMVALAIFMPVLIGLGGNAGTQTLAVVVRGLALGQLRSRQVFRIVLYEVRNGALLGLVLGLAVGLLAFYWKRDALLGWIVGLSLQGTITLSTAVGAGIPLCLKTLGIDPALASGPFITTTVDAAGLFIYLGLATLLLKVFYR